jgi:hypothetical protein
MKRVIQTRFLTGGSFDLQLRLLTTVLHTTMITSQHVSTGLRHC